MKNYIYAVGDEFIPQLIKYLIVMKLIVLLIIASLFQVHAESFAQTVSLSKENVSIVEVFREIKKQTNYNIISSSALIKEIPLISIDVKNASLDELLDQLLSPNNLAYLIEDKSIIIKRKPTTYIKKTGVVEKIVQDPLTIRGRVLDTQEPPQVLPGVTVQIKGKNVGVITDAEGYFSINATRGDVLVFSMLGFVDFESSVTTSTSSLTVALKEDVLALDEIVVVGLNERQRKHIASSVASLDISSNIEGKPITQLSQALQGGMTGIQVNQASGMPGRDDAQILVRGRGTIGNSNPLILVDGIPMAMDDIDPVTVESITVLKDAAAAASYGSRAANGVILVTTKRGAPGRVQVSYNGYYGISNPTFLPKLVDGVTFMEMSNEAAANSGLAESYSQKMIDSTALGLDRLKYPSTNWIDLIIKNNAALTNHSLSVSGGSQVARFAVTGNYIKQDGMVALSDMQRYNLRANTSITITDKLVVNLDLLTNRTERREPQRPSETGGNLLLEDLYKLPPTMVARYPDKNGQAFYDSYLTLGNPLAVIEQGGFQRWRTEVSNINLHPKWQVLPRLNIKGQFNYQIQSFHDVVHRDAFLFLDYETGNEIQPTWGALRESYINKNNYFFLGASADYTLNLDKHNFLGIAGYSQEQRAEGNWNQWSILSAYAKLNYAYDDRYLVEATMRMDGSSRFGPGHKYGYFPSIAVGWNVHNEGFMRNQNVVSNLKLRTSYGELGNQSIGLYLYQSTISASTGVESKYGNPDLTWETVGMFNAGIDLGFFKNSKIGITADYYRKLTSDMLMQPKISMVGGISSSPLVNEGSVLNKGFEVAVNYAERFSDWSFSVRPGFTWNENKITRFSAPSNAATNASTWVRITDEKGYPIRSYRGYKTDGLLQSADFDADGKPLIPVISDKAGPGDIKYLDSDGNGVLNEDDYVYIGDPVPKANYFANLQLAVKNFDFEFLLQGTGKNSAMLMGMMALPLDKSHADGTPTEYYNKNYWTPERTDVRFPRLLASPGVNKHTSDYWLENGAYLRVKYIQAGFNFKPNTLNRIGLKALRVYINAQNPITFKKMVLMDPESRGGQYTYPIMKMYTAGINIRF